jgi:hypothetical protein
MQLEGIPIGSAVEKKLAKLPSGMMQSSHRGRYEPPAHQALITNQQIAASALNKNTEHPLSGKLDSFDQFYLAHHFAKIMRRIANAESGVGN